MVNHDLARYHAAADVGAIEAHWIDEDDLTVGPAVAKEVGEIGIVGTAAVIANTVHDAISVRVRDLPIRLGSCSGDRCSPSSLAAGISTWGQRDSDIAANGDAAAAYCVHPGSTMTLNTTARRSNPHLLLAAATAMLALSACGRGDTDDDTVVVSNTVHMPFDSDTVDLPFPQLSPPECTDPIAVAAGNEGLGFDPVDDDGVTPPPEGSDDHMPEGEWEWICGRG